MQSSLIKHQLRKLQESDLGQDIIEFALVLPILLALTIGTMDLARVVMTYNTISNAAREGARYGIIHPNDTAGIQARAQGLTSGLDSALMSITVNRPNWRTIEVDVQYSTPLITSFLINAASGNPNLTLRAVSRMQVE